MALGEGARFGDYRIESVLGKGGMGSVYVAQDTRLDRQVALKVLSAEMADDPGFRDRFVAESRIAASLDHPNIVPVFEAGDVDGQLFLAMRYVRGSDLASILAADGPLDPGRASAIVAQIATALDAAHRAGLVHRDVKPANILVTEGPRPGTEHAYLSDFGLTKRTAETGGLTRAGQVLGTVDYIAPEQIEGGEIDGRADIYSLGCVLYECLAGGPPYRRDTDMAVLYAHVRAPVPSLAEVRPEIPAATVTIVERAMAKAPDDRFATAGEMAEALAMGVVLPIVAVSEPDHPTRIGGRRQVLAAGLVTFGLVVAIAVAAASGTFDEQAAASPTPDLGAASPSPSAPAAASPGTAEGTAGLIAVPTLDPEGAAAPEPVTLAPGRWAFTEFDPKTSFQLGPGWTADRDFPDGAQLNYQAGDVGGGITLGRAQVVFQDGCDGATSLLGTDPQDFIAWVQAHPYLESGDPLPVSVGGRTAISITSKVLEKPETACPQRPTPRVILFPIALDTFFGFPGETIRFVIAAWDGAPIMLAISESNPDFAPIAQAVVESMEFEE